MDAKQLLSESVARTDGSVDQTAVHTDSYCPRLPSNTLSALRQQISRGDLESAPAPRGTLLNGVNPIKRTPVNVTLPYEYEVVLATDKFLVSKFNPEQCIAMHAGDMVTIPKGTVVQFDGQTMTVIEGASEFKDSDRGHVRVFGEWLYLTRESKPIRFTKSSGLAPSRTQFLLKAAAAHTATSSASQLLEIVQGDLSMQSGSVIDRQAA